MEEASLYVTVTITLMVYWETDKHNSNHSLDKVASSGKTHWRNLHNVYLLDLMTFERDLFGEARKRFSHWDQLKSYWQLTCAKALNKSVRQAEKVQSHFI